MLTNPAIDPVAFHLFSWPVHWYGLMYLVGFIAGWALLYWRSKKAPQYYPFTQDEVADIVFAVALGVIIGGRLGYILFYDWQVLLTNPLFILQAWKGGMSFHGGLLGVLIALWICTRKLKKPFLALTDFIAPVVPIGLGAGRIGNFINGELWGKVTEGPLGMVFPQAGDALRHPSQLYEFALEGVVLFIILWVYSRKPRPLGAISGLFAICYSIFRIAVEFVREPDAPIGYIAFGWLTEGQLLSIPLFLVGVALMVCAYKCQRGKRT